MRIQKRSMPYCDTSYNWGSAIWEQIKGAGQAQVHNAVLRFVDRADGFSRIIRYVTWHLELLGAIKCYIFIHRKIPNPMHDVQLCAYPVANEIPLSFLLKFTHLCGFCVNCNRNNECISFLFRYLYIYCLMTNKCRAKLRSKILPCTYHRASYSLAPIRLLWRAIIFAQRMHYPKSDCKCQLSYL